MVITICRLYETYDDASRTVRDLEAAEISADDTSIISNNAENWYESSPSIAPGETSGTAGAGATGPGMPGADVAAAGGAAAGAAAGMSAGTRDEGAGAGRMREEGALDQGREQRQAGQPGTSRREQGRSDRTEGAAVGAVIGATAGTAASLLASLGLMLVPGVGPVVGAGWLLALLGGTAVGGLTGGLLGALSKAGVDEDEAQVYAEGVRRGGSLVTARVPEEQSQRVMDIMDRSAVNTRERAEEYRRSGWQAFNPDAQPYSPEQVRSERELHLAR